VVAGTLNNYENNNQTFLKNLTDITILKELIKYKQIILLHDGNNTLKNLN